MATNLLNFFSMGSDRVAFMVGVSRFGCAAGMDSMKTESGGAAGNGLLVALAVN